MKNLFITGITSYLGENLFSNLKNYNIFALEHRKTIASAPNLTILKKLPENLNQYFITNNIEFIIHLATNSERVNQVDNIEDIINTNITLGLKILNASLDSNVKKIISAGSYSQDVLIDPLNAYTISKQYFEDLQKIYSKNYNLRNTSIHFGDIYGPKDNRNKLVPFIKANENTPMIKFNSDGKGYFSPVFINDAIDSIVEELTNERESLFALKSAASELIYVEEFVELYKSIRDKNFEHKFTGKTVSNFSSIDNFKPSKNLKYSLNEGLNLI